MARSCFAIFLFCVIILSLCNDGELEEIKLPPSIGFKIFRVFNSSHAVSLLTTYYDTNSDLGVVLKKELSGYDIKLFNYRQRRGYSINVESKQCNSFYINSNTLDYNPKEFLKLISSNLKYLNTDEVIGIKSTIYTSTSKTAGPLATDEVYAMFAYQNWSFPHRFEDNSFSRPVSFSGLKNGNEFLYEFYFLDVVDSVPEDAFFPPPSVTCSGYSSYNYKSPGLIKSFQLEAEVYDDRREKSEVKMYVDSNTKMLREDIRVIKDGFPSPVVSITDRTFGVVYTFDEASGKCLSTNPLPPSYRPSSDMTLISIGRLFLSQNLYNLQFVATRDCWLGNCEVWTTNNYNSKYHEIYWKRSQQKVDGILTNVDIPVRMDTFARVNYSYTARIGQQHVFNFEPKYPDWSLFDISECYNESNLLRFQVTFRSSYYTLESIINFERQFIESIKKLTNIPVVRINKIRMDSLLNEMLLVSATLIEYFQRANITGSQPGAIPYRKPNIDIYNMLSDAVDEKKFVVSAKNASGFTLNFTAEAITKYIMSEKEIDQQGSSLVKFTLTRQKAVAPIPSDLVISNTPVDECARICDQEQSSTCDMFMYCKSTATCTLSEKHVEDRTDTYANTDCDLYSREYAYDYKLYEGVRLKLKDDSIVSGKDLRLCLSECFRQQNDSFACHSIDYCTDGTKFTCVYHSEHITQVSQTDIIPDGQCIHYSQNYIEMYHLFPNSKWDKPETNYAIVKRDVDANECALSCTLDPVGCTDFEMCQMYPGFGRKTQCILYEKFNVTGNRPTKTIMTESCDHYTYKGIKTKFDFGKDVITPEARTATNADYSGGDMAGLGIPMLLVGGIAGFLAVYFYAKYQFTRGNDQNLVMQLIK